MSSQWELIYSTAFMTASTPQAIYIQVDDLKVFEAIQASLQDWGRVKVKLVEAGPQRIIFQYWDRRVVDDLQVRLNRLIDQACIWGAA